MVSAAATRLHGFLAPHCAVLWSAAANHHSASQVGIAVPLFLVAQSLAGCLMSICDLSLAHGSLLPYWYPNMHIKTTEVMHYHLEDYYCVVCTFAFNALTQLVGHQEEHPACKNWVMRYWCGYLSAARCRLFAYGQADATASHNPIIF